MNKRSSFRAIMVGLHCSLVVGLILVTGCSGTGKSRGNVTGKVTYKGQPVTGGVVTFFVSNGDQYKGKASALINAQGQYYQTGVPAGNAVVTVDTEPVKAMEKNTKDPEAAVTKGEELPGESGIRPELKGVKYLKIPEIYRFKNKSTLKYTVNSGNQTIDIDLQ